MSELCLDDLIRNSACLHYGAIGSLNHGVLAVRIFDCGELGNISVIGNLFRETNALTKARAGG
jgi:hypothetical protein